MQTDSAALGFFQAPASKSGLAITAIDRVNWLTWPRSIPLRPTQPCVKIFFRHRTHRRALLSIHTFCLN